MQRHATIFGGVIMNNTNTNDFLTVEELHALVDTFEAMKQTSIQHACYKVATSLTSQPSLMTKEIAIVNATNKVINNIKDVIVSSISYQLDAKNRIITECEILDDTPFLNEILIKSNCNGWCEDVKVLYSYYHDELRFYASDFIGLTEKEAISLCTSRDVAYLRR